MSRPRSLSARLSAAGAASLAALSLLVTSLTPPLRREQVQLMRACNRLKLRHLKTLRVTPSHPPRPGPGPKPPTPRAELKPLTAMLALRLPLLRLLLRISLVPAALAPSKMIPQPWQ